MHSFPFRDSNLHSTRSLSSLKVHIEVLLSTVFLELLIPGLPAFCRVLLQMEAFLKVLFMLPVSLLSLLVSWQERWGVPVLNLGRSWLHGSALGYQHPERMAF